MSEGIERLDTSPKIDTTGWKSYLINFLNWFDKPLEKISANIIIIFIFSMIYGFIILNSEEEDQFKTIEDVVYFTFTTHFTVGFGDKSPKSRLGRIVMMVHVFFVWMVNMVPMGLQEIMNLSENLDKDTKRKKMHHDRLKQLIQTKTSKLEKSIRRRSKQTMPMPLTEARHAVGLDFDNIGI